MVTSRHWLRSGLVGAWCLAAVAIVHAGPPLINTGHVGTVTALVTVPSQQVLVSGGEDGAVRVWNTGTHAIRQHLRVGLQPIVDLAVHPTRPLVAVLRQTDAAGAGLELSVWDWRAGEERHRRQLDGPPLYLGFSSKGTWLVYTRPEWESVVLLDAQTGSQRTWPGFGIVSFVATSTSERTLMAYQPSGRISYWSMATRRQSSALDTAPALEDLALSNDKSLLIGRNGARLLGVDVVTGGVAVEVDAAQALGPIDAPRAGLSAGVSPTRAEVVLAGRTGGGQIRLAAFDHRRGMTPTWSAELPAKVASLALGTRGAYMGSTDGIWRVAPFSRASAFSEDQLAPISSLAFADGHMVVGGGEQVAVVRSSFFDVGPAPSRARGRAPASRQVPTVTVFDVEGNLPGAVDVASPRWLATSSDATPIWVWNADGSDGRLAVLDPLRRRLRMAPLAFPSPLAAVTPHGDMLLAREPSGVLTLLDAVSVARSAASLDSDIADEELMAQLVRGQFWTPGVTDATVVGERLVAATARGSDIATALVQIDIATTETVPLSDPALVIYDLEHTLGTLVTLGIEPGATGPVTVLKQHSGPSYRSKRTIHRVANEDLGASVVVDPAGRRFYSSLGSGAVREWTGARLVDLEESGHQPRRLYVIGDRLVALNTDRTLSVWDRISRELLLDLYLFRDHEWLAATADGVVLSSRDSSRYLAAAADAALAGR